MGPHPGVLGLRDSDGPSPPPSRPLQLQPGSRGESAAPAPVAMALGPRFPSHDLEPGSAAACSMMAHSQSAESLRGARGLQLRSHLRCQVKRRSRGQLGNGETRRTRTPLKTAVAAALWWEYRRRTTCMPAVASRVPGSPEAQITRSQARACLRLKGTALWWSRSQPQTALRVHAPSALWSFSGVWDDRASNPGAVSGDVHVPPCIRRMQPSLLQVRQKQGRS